VLTGTRSSDTGGLLSMDNMSPPHTLQANAIVVTASSALNHDKIANRVAFFLVSLFSPSLSRWCDIIDAGHFTTRSDLTSTQVWRHLPPSIIIHKGHLEHQHYNQHSTQPAPVVVPNDGLTNAQEAKVVHYNTFPPEPPASRSHYIYADCQVTTGMVYIDHTCRFLQPSTS
jgi:hypothetical protein